MSHVLGGFRELGNAKVVATAKAMATALTSSLCGAWRRRPPQRGGPPRRLLAHQLVGAF